jgi:hypothetical protein
MVNKDFANSITNMNKTLKINHINKFFTIKHKNNKNLLFHQFPD